MRKLIVLLLMSMALLTGCDSSSSDPLAVVPNPGNAPPPPVDRNGLSEKDLTEEPGLALMPGEVMVTFLEPPTGVGDLEPDTGPLGQDLIPLTLPQPATVNLNLGGSAPFVASVVLRNGAGGELIRVNPANPMATIQLQAGDFQLEVNSAAGRMDNDDLPVFLVTSQGVAPREDVLAQGNQVVTIDTFGECIDCDMNGVDLADTELSFVNLTGSTLRGANLTGTQMTFATLDRCDLTGVQGRRLKLSSSTGHDAVFTGGVLRNAQFTSFEADRAVFDDAQLHNASLFASQFNGGSFNDILSAEFSCRNVTAEDSTWLNAQLPMADFGFGVLNRADFTGAQLPGASFNFAKLNNAIFTGADLTGVSFSFAETNGTIFP